MVWVWGERWRKRERNSLLYRCQCQWWEEEGEEERGETPHTVQLKAAIQVHVSSCPPNKYFLHFPPGQVGFFWNDPGFFPLDVVVCCHYLQPCHCCWSCSGPLVGALLASSWGCNPSPQCREHHTRMGCCRSLPSRPLVESSFWPSASSWWWSASTGAWCQSSGRNWSRSKGRQIWYYETKKEARVISKESHRTRRKVEEALIIRRTTSLGTWTWMVAFSWTVCGVSPLSSSPFSSHHWHVTPIQQTISLSLFLHLSPQTHTMHDIHT